jgi:four helix bundle protein
MGRLDHERMDVYELVRQYNRLLHRLLLSVNATGFSAHLDQLRRAGASIGLNLAEGGGEYTPKEKARFYRMARRSATESAAALDWLVDVQATTEEAIEPARVLLRRITAILTRLTRRNESPGRG